MASKKTKKSKARGAKKAAKKPNKKTSKKPNKKTKKAAPKKPARKAAQKKPVKKTKSAAPRQAKAFSRNPLLNTILTRLDEDQAINTVQIDLANKSTIADTMVVTSGRSNRHVNAIADHIVEGLHKSGVSRVRVEGMPNCDWVLIDAGDVIVHIFRPEVRSFYNLEKMWARSPAKG
jgi:ribosome-associated protein